MTHFLNLSFPIALLQAIHKPRSIAVLWLQSGSTELTASGWLAEAPLSIPLWNFPLDPVFCCSDTYWWGKSVLTTRSLVAKPSRQPLPGTNQMFLLFWSKFHTSREKFCMVLTVTRQWPADLNRDHCSRRKWHFMSRLLIQPSTNLWPWEANLARQHPWGCCMALRKQPNSQHAFAFLCRVFYFSGEITTARKS